MSCASVRLYHVELLGDSSSAQLLHAVADVTEAGVVVLGVLLRKVINVAQRTVLERGKRKGAGGGERALTAGTATSCQRKAANLIGPSAAATAQTHWESFGGSGEGFGPGLLTLRTTSQLLSLIRSRVQPLSRRGQRHFQRRHDGVVFQERVCSPCFKLCCKRDKAN